MHVYGLCCALCFAFALSRALSISLIEKGAGVYLDVFCS